MANFLAPIINDQQENANGEPLSGGTIEVYLAGTSTPATTFSDQAGAVPNTWPIVLNTLGVNNQGAVWLTGGSAYKFIIKDSLGIVQRTIDNVTGINDTAGANDQWIVYQAAPTFINATSFSVAGDQTQIFQVGRRIRTSNTGGTIYSTITGSVYSAPNTTVTVRNDSGVLDSGLSQVSYGVMSVLDTSLPGGMINYGQCRLQKSGANLLLSPYNGNRITINGSICVIPTAGVTLAPTALAINTVFNIYAFMNGATLTLEASATVHATDATTGVEIKSGDATRTLVGKARTIAGPAWQDTDAQRFVISWFNQKPRRIYNSNAGTPSTGSTTPVVLISAMEFLTFGESCIPASFVGNVANNTANGGSFTALSINSTTVAAHAPCLMQAYAAGAQGPAVGSSTFIPSEGYNFIHTVGFVTAGSTGTWGANLEMSGTIQS